jgi:hypothetical protein
MVGYIYIDGSLSRFMRGIDSDYESYSESNTLKALSVKLQLLEIGAPHGVGHGKRITSE